MASEIRVDKINSLSGLGTVTLSPTGVDIAGITTAATLRATTGIITSLTIGSLTSLGDVDIADTIVHTGDTNTKIRFPAADTVSVETGGSERLRILSDGNLQVPIGSNVEIGQTASSNHADGNAGSVLLGIQDGGGSKSGVKVTNVDAGTYNDQIVTFLTAQGGVSTPTERLRIASDGAVGVNSTAPQTAFDVLNTGQTGITDVMLVKNFSAGNSFIRFQDNDGTSNFSLGADDGSGLGANAFILYDRVNSAYRMGIDNSGNMKLHSGNLVIGTSGKGIDFSATGDGSGTDTSELLDDYEEGTWTITVSPGGGSYGVSHMVARYVKIGSLVTVQGWWRASSVSGVSGSLTVSGFPYATLDYSSGGGVRQHLNLNVAHVNYSGLTFAKLRLGNNSAQGSIMGNTAGASGGLNTWTAGNIAVASELYINGSYIAAQ